jgi:hypothetical protein
MNDLTGKRIVLTLEETLEDRVKMRGALFQTGDVGIVLMAHRKLQNAWIVIMHERAVLFFADELKEYEDVICQDCRARADADPNNPGCGESCETRDCFCQHCGRRIPPIEKEHAS